MKKFKRIEAKVNSPTVSSDGKFAKKYKRDSALSTQNLNYLNQYNYSKSLKIKNEAQ